MMKRTKKLLSILLCCAMLLGMLPAAAMAAEAPYGVRPESAAAGDLTCTVDSDGVLTWTAVPGATSYELNIRMGGGLIKSETGLTSPYYELEAMLDQYKKDSGTVQVMINVLGGSENGGTANFLYSSPYPKLEAPTMLAWNDNSAVWNAVANADNYQIWLYQPGGSAYSHWDTPNTYFNFTEIPAVANVLGDGWFFKVKATSLENYRDSEFNESGRKGFSPAGGLREGTTSGTGGKLTFTVDASGVLSWNEVPGASGYTLSIRHNGDYFMNVSAALPVYDLQALLEEYRMDHGTVEVSVTPDGENSLAYQDTASFLYSSPYGKLEAPAGLVWDGNIADWNDVPYADGYTVYLYQPSGSAYNHWTTTESQIDFSTVANPQGDWYFKVKATAVQDTRDSEFTESPRKNPYEPSTQFAVGVYAYNDTLAQEDSGGEVMLSTSGGDYDWSADGYTEQVLGGSYVTVKARPASGYRFVEWRQGTQGDTVSNSIYYSFTSTGPRYLYAIFEEGDPGETLPITGVSLSGLSVPTVGERISDVDGSDLTENPSGRNKYRVIDNQTSSWKDEEGNLIEYGLQTFEAGRTYSISFNVSPKDGYAFTSSDIPVELYDLYSHDYTASMERYPETKAAKVTFTFTMPGERTYEDISNFRFYQMRAPEDGDSVSTVNGVWAYNNAGMTDRYWTNSEGVRLDNGIPFVSGRTYYYNYEFTAFDGYKFAANLFVRADNEEVTNWEYIFNNERTTVHIKIPYYIGSAETVGSVVVNGMFVPNQTKSTRDWDSNVYLSVPNNSNYTIPLQTKSWYEVDAEYSVDTQYKVTEPNFRAGKQYKMFLIVHANDGYKFAPLDTVSFAFAGVPEETYTYTVLSGGSESIIEVVVTFTAQFPDDVGQDANHPAWCYSYPELKTALESSSIRYVALGDVEDMLPSIPHDEEKDPGGITRTAIVVRGTKDLNLLGDAVFRCPLTGNYDLKYYIQLLTLTDAADSNLYIHGPGSLTYAGGTLNFVNSVIEVEGGNLCVDGATVRGSNGYHTAFCYGINAVFGSVSIQGGATVIGEIYGGDGGISALTLGSEGVDRSLSVSIYDGKFYVERDEGDSDEDHGIMVNNDIGLRIYGMTTDGIKLGRYAADTLADYIADGTAMTVDGVVTAPASCGTTAGTVAVFKEISKVNIHVNSPVAGKAPAMYAEDVYMAPDGVTVQAPVWYKDGQLWNVSTGSAQFEAGSSYRVEITLLAGEGVKFADPLPSATINYKPAAVSAFAGNAEKGVTLSVDLGECSNTVADVGVEIDAPRKGGTPDQLLNSTTTPGYAKAVEYGIQWQESTDGSSWTELAANGTFTVGRYYRVFINLKAESGYAFALNSSLDPEVSATVNGNAAEVFRFAEENPDEYIFLRYNFGILNDIYIPEIRVNDIVEPKAGQKPAYTCTIGGNGYTINTAYSGGTTIDGIFWYDLTDDVAMTGNRTFTLGNEYKVVIDVKTEDGFEFSTEQVGGSYRPAGAGYINGKPATFGIDSDGRFEQNVQYIFTCGAQEITSVMLSGLDEPVGGKAPDTAMTAAYPEYYTVQSVTWTDIEGGAVGAVFETGVPYQATIVVKAKPDVYFNEPAVYIDGSQANSNKITVSNEKDTVTVVYTFSKPASAPELPSNIPVSGSAVSGNDSDDAVYLLYKSSTADATILQEWAAGAYNALYTAAKGGITDTTVNGKAMKEQSFTFEGVQMGVYKLAILKPGGYAPKIVGVTATGASVELGRQILQLRADVDADGEHSAKDVTLLRRGLAGGYGVSLDIYAADANGDGEPNAKDVTLLRRVLAGGFGVTIG